MIKYTETTVFNVGAQTIVNTVNCVGIMGAGLALEYQLRFPEMYKDYVEKCKKKEVQIGKPYLYQCYANPWILNFPTKNNWRHSSKIQWIEQGLDYYVKNYNHDSMISIAFPKLGCDKGGLKWSDVQAVMEKYLQSLSIDVYICLDRELEASGIEGDMIKLINNIQDRFWISQFRDEIASKILNAIPIKRFRDLKLVKGISKQTYNKLFKILYSIAVEKDSELSQNSNLIKPVQLKFVKGKTVSVTNKEPIKNQPDIENTKLGCTISKPKMKSKVTLDTKKRNQVIFMLKYRVGLELTEIYRLRWCDFCNEENLGRVTVYGKVISTPIWQKIQSLGECVSSNEPIFRSRRGGSLSLTSVKTIVRNAAKEAGFGEKFLIT